MAPSFVPLSPSGAVVDPLQNTCHPDQILFLNLSVVKLMYQLKNLLWHLVRCRFLHVTWLSVKVSRFEVLWKTPIRQQ